MMNAIAWELLTNPDESLRDPQRALAISRRACALGEARSLPDLGSWLDTLALALHRTGDHEAAIDAQRRAIDLLPADAPAAMKAEMNSRLSEYESAAER